MTRRSKKKRRTAKSAYATAGVDIDEMMQSLAAVKRMVKSTATRGVLSEIGSFGGLVASPGKDHVLVASTDGVGTKLKVAVMARRHNTVGQDLVNHCVNDILAQGATPLFFMDYLGTARLKAPVFREVVAGLCKACKQNGCALLGGETAEMPGLYPPNEYDLVGTIVGSVPRNSIITGRKIRKGDVILGLPSTGLHTNGYSLARKIVFEKAGLGIRSTFPGTKRTVADVLLAVHRSYLKPVGAAIRTGKVRGIAHITGGGLPDNVARIVPDGLTAVFDCSSWRVPHVFRYLQEKGKIRDAEMYRVFNMGIGMVVIVPRRSLDSVTAVMSKSGGRVRIIGHVENGTKPVRSVPTSLWS